MLLGPLWFSDFILWEHLNSRVYNPKPGITDEQKGAIGLEIRNNSREMCRNEIDNYKQMIDVIIR